MAITVQCDGCGRQFRADERFAGKRMRCKNCGTVLVVPGGAEPVGGVSPKLDDGDLMLDSLADAAAESTRAGGAPAIGPTTPPPGARPPGWVPPVQIFSAEEPLKLRGIRRSVAFDFPFADLLDTWAPRVIVFGSLAWLVYEALNSRETTPTWVPLARLGLLLALFAIIMLPMTVRGIELAARKFRFTYPPSPGWRTFATFFFPFTLAYILWHVSGDIGSIVLGLITGLIVSVGLFWFLFRIVPRELPMAFAYAAGSFLVSAVVVGAVVFGLNMLALTVAQASRQAHQFASSPMGPSLKWDSTPPPPAPEEKKPERKKPAPPRAAPAPADRATEAPPSVAPAPAAPRVSEAPLPAGQPAQDSPPPADPPIAPRLPSIFDEGSFSDDDAAATPPGQNNENVASAARASPRTSPRIAHRPTPKVVDAGAGPMPGIGSEILKPLTEAPVDGFDRIVFPKTPGTCFALVRAVADDEDEIELWDSAQYELKSAVRFRHDGNGQEQNYILSPDGKFLLRLVSWPRLLVQVWSFEKEDVVENISLSERYGVPRLVGFSSNEVFLVSWRRGSSQAIETFNAATGKRLKQIDLPAHERSEANFAISANGLRGAIAGRDQNGRPVIQIIDLTGGMGAKRWEIQSLRDRAVARPAGLAFSRKADRLVALFEEGSKVLVVCWNLDGKQVFEQLFQSDRPSARAPAPRAPVGPPMVMPPMIPPRDNRQPARTARDEAAEPAYDGFDDTYFTARQLPSALDWLSDGSALIVRGQWLLDGRSGEKLADIPLTGAVAQRALDDFRIEVVHTADKESRLAIVELDPASLAKALAPGR